MASLVIGDGENVNQLYARNHNYEAKIESLNVREEVKVHYMLIMILVMQLIGNSQSEHCNYPKINTHGLEKKSTTLISTLQ